MKYKHFILKSVYFLAICLLLLGYQGVMYLRAQDQEIADLQTQVNQLTGERDALLAASGASDGASADGSAQAQYIDGTYAGEAEGFGGAIKVSVTIEGGSLTSIEITEAAGEDEAYLSLARGVIDEMLESQSAEVDTVSGATYSSTGIRDAVAQALEQAVN